MWLKTALTQKKKVGRDEKDEKIERKENKYFTKKMRKQTKQLRYERARASVAATGVGLRTCFGFQDIENNDDRINNN